MRMLVVIKNDYDQMSNETVRVISEVVRLQERGRARKRGDARRRLLALRRAFRQRDQGKFRSLAPFARAGRLRRHCSRNHAWSGGDGAHGRYFGTHERHYSRCEVASRPAQERWRTSCARGRRCGSNRGCRERDLGPAVKGSGPGSHLPGSSGELRRA